MAIPAKESSDLRTTVFTGTSEMAARMRALNWSATALGAVHQWPLELVGATRVLLGNRFQLLLLWGNSLCCLYNDAYISVLGAKHPWALGRPVKEVWSEAWPVIGPMFESVMAGGPAKWTDDLQLIIHRNGFDEETHFVVSYSPVPLGEKAGMVGGVLCTVYETSEKVLAERRITMLRELGAIAIEEGVEEKQVAAHALEVMGRNTADLPFALLYLAGGNSTRLSLAGAVGVRSGSQAAPLSMEVAPGMMWLSGPHFLIQRGG